MKSYIIGTAIAYSLSLVSPYWINAADEMNPIDLPTSTTISEIKAPSIGTHQVGEIKIPLSVSRGACPSGVKTLEIQIRGITGLLNVKDVLPSTAQEEVFGGPIHISSKTTSEMSVELRYVIAQGQLAGEASHVATSAMVGELLPPKNTVVSSGTTDRGHGAFFRFQQTARNELGMRRWLVLLVEKNGPFGDEPYVVEFRAVGEAGEITEGAMLFVVTSPGTDHERSRQDAARLAALYAKVDRLRSRMNTLLGQADIVRNKLAFPLLGFGTKRANILGAVASLENEYEQLLSEMCSIEGSPLMARLVVQYIRFQQSRYRYDALARQADELRNTSGFPYGGLGSAHARATKDMTRVKDQLDQNEKEFDDLIRNWK